MKQFILLLSSLIILTGCGGGGGDSSSNEILGKYSGVLYLTSDNSNSTALSTLDASYEINQDDTRAVINETVTDEGEITEMSFIGPRLVDTVKVTQQETAHCVVAGTNIEVAATYTTTRTLELNYVDTGLHVVRTRDINGCNSSVNKHSVWEGILDKEQ